MRHFPRWRVAYRSLQASWGFENPQVFALGAMVFVGSGEGAHVVVVLLSMVAIISWSILCHGLVLGRRCF